MKAVILAAGRSTRLYPVTLGLPKCLLGIGNDTLIGHQLSVLHQLGVGDIVVVTGYYAAQIRARYDDQVRFVHNPDYATTNNLHSLWVARKEVQDRPFLCLHADVLFHPSILVNCLMAERHVCLVVDEEIAEETMKVKGANGRVTAVGKHVRPEEAYGTFLGIAKFSAEGSRALFDVMASLIGNECYRNAYFTVAVEALIGQGLDVQASFTNGLPWIEIDFPQDLVRARVEIMERIRTVEGSGNGWSSHWPSHSS